MVNHMIQLKETLKKLPGLYPMYKMLKGYHLKSKDTEQVFTDIYKTNKWRGKDSASGTGSDVHQTRVVSKELPALFNEFEISSMLDIPCGDFHWMKDVDLTNIAYTGTDIVSDLIRNNIEKYRKDGVYFQKLDLITDSLPTVDLVFCRDCLVHLSFKDMFRALDNVCNSQSKYLLTTTYTKRKINFDIYTGQWRTLNLEIAPFMLPSPIKLIKEGCTEGNGAFSDKTLGLWRINDIRTILERRCNVTTKC